MKKLCRRIFILTAMLMLVTGVNAFAATRQYSAKTIYFPNQYGAGWSNQFTLSTWSNISVSISMNSTSGASSYYLNEHLTYVFQNVYTKQQYTLTGKNIYAYNYTMEVDVPAGTYSLGVYYSGVYNFNLYFSIYGSGGVKIPDTFELAVGESQDIYVYEENTQYGGYIKQCSSSNDNVVMITNINNNVSPSKFTIQGMGTGVSVITVYGSDGSYDQMTVNVVAAGAKPTLLYTSLSLDGGDIVYNEVLSTSSNITVKWSSTNKNVAVVKKNGKIKAKGSGRCTIYASVTLNSTGRTYKLSCAVTVARSDPYFKAYVSKVSGNKKKVIVKLTNMSGVNMQVYSSGAALFEDRADADYKIRKLKLKSGSTTTVKNNKTQKLTFIIKGDKVTNTGVAYAVRIKFKLDGRTYYSMVYANPERTRYILKQDYASNNWLYSY